MRLSDMAVDVLDDFNSAHTLCDLLVVRWSVVN